MARYTFIVAYTDNYLPGLTALTYSIKRYIPHAELIVHHGTSVEDTAIKRFQIASDCAHKYDAICLMDADMFLTADCTLFFDVASKGFIVTGSNGMIIDFNQEYQKRYGIDLGRKHYPYTKVHTTAPIFISSQDVDWFEKLYNSRRIDSWDDFLYLNILGIQMGKDKKMICMPPYMFTGIHHWQVKPATAVMEKDGILMAGTEEQVYMVHGKFWDPPWLNGLMPPMEGYFRDEQIGETGRRKSINSFELLKRRFKELN